MAPVTGSARGTPKGKWADTMIRLAKIHSSSNTVPASARCTRGEASDSGPHPNHTKSGQASHSVATGNPSARPEAMYKVSFLGESSVGKTSILHRYSKGRYTANIMSTIGMDFVTLPMVVDGMNLCMKVWDTAGQERFRTLTMQFFRGAKGLFFVYDLSSRDSYERITDWLQMASKDGLTPMREVMFIVGNKNDLPDSEKEVDVKEAEEFAEAHHCKHFVVSAKTGEGITELFQVMMTDLKDSFGPHSSTRTAFSQLPRGSPASNSAVPRKVSGGFQLHAESHESTVCESKARPGEKPALSCCRAA
ncbi:ras-related protein Rab-1B-like [Sycon ciliatum]|uniref:ras-related protein Rab-1B-like n=1 Tax=Sycon ciliatum TaxID=27933 RepID=UPI0020AD763E|eukprot:scpid75553/ scgid14828/ Ras-related protein Rab-1B